VPYGLAITPERLRQIEAAEQMVRAAGIREFRVRHHGAVARLEVAPTEMNDALDAASALNEQLRSLGFSRVLLDAEGYRQGSLNEAPLVKLAKQRGFKPAVQELVAEADIAVIDVPFEALDDLKAAAPELRRAGYRYVAIDLANVPSRSRS
jgi:PP-loop superfamily ATP-utilizing enzyme